MGTGEFNAGGNPAMDWHPIQGGVEIFLVASCHGNRDKLRPGGPLGSYADFTFFFFLHCLSSLEYNVYHPVCVIFLIKLPLQLFTVD